jgi:hypothetical protein
VSARSWPWSRAALAFAAVLLTASLAVAALSLRGPPARHMKRVVEQRSLLQVPPVELARWIIEGRRDFVVIDLRKDAAYEAGHVRDAVNCGSCHGDRAAGRQAQVEHFIDLSKKLVLYTDAGDAALELPPIVARNPRLQVLAGGWEAWRRDILAPVVFGGETDRSALEAKLRREAVRAFFAGERLDGGSVAPAPAPIVPVKRDGAHKPAGPSEGC